jgi:hypothetical protein
LACDLVEPWRARIDDWVWQQFRNRELRAEQFGRDGAGACLMGKAARGQFYAAITPLQQRCAAGLRRHARLAARALADAADLPADDGWALDDADGESDDAASAPSAAVSAQVDTGSETTGEGEP